MRQHWPVIKRLTKTNLTPDNMDEYTRPFWFNYFCEEALSGYATGSSFILPSSRAPYFNTNAAQPTAQKFPEIAVKRFRRQAYWRACALCASITVSPSPAARYFMILNGPWLPPSKPTGATRSRHL
ncbi:MAG: hypothetical protein WBX22_07045 [Silvibacterium sp.]